MTVGLLVARSLARAHAAAPATTPATRALGVRFARAHAAHEAKKRANVDAARRALLQRHSMLIRTAVRTRDEARLAVAVGAAKRDSVPKLVIDKALNSLVHPGAEAVLVEASAPGGVLLVVRASTLNRATLMHEIRRCFNQHEIGALTAALWAFDKESSLRVAKESVAQDALELLAMQHGVDDVREASGTEDLLCVSVGEDAEQRMSRFAAALTVETGLAAPVIETALIPSAPVVIDDPELLERVSSLLDDLSDLECVEDVFTNLS